MEGGALWGVTGDQVYAMLVEWRLDAGRLADRVGDDFSVAFQAQPQWVDVTDWRARWQGLNRW